MKIRITIEYDLEEVGDVAQEQQDWIDGNVDFQDIWSLYCDGDLGTKVQFQTFE